MLLTIELYLWVALTGKEIVAKNAATTIATTKSTVIIADLTLLINTLLYICQPVWLVSLV
jgi:hypothetical protein